MATYTSHYNLKKPATSDKIRIADFNGNADTIDTTMYDNATLIGKLKADVGIVENTNTATHNISSGQYVIWKGDLYTASSAISSGATLSSANLTAVSSGGLNSLSDHIAQNLAMYNNANAVIKDGTTVQVTATESMDSYNNIQFVFYYNGRQEIKEIFVGGTQSSVTYHLAINSNGSDGHFRIFTIDFTVSGRYITSPTVKYSYDLGAFQSYTGNDLMISGVRGYN